MEKASYQATGRRKSSVARVRMVPGTGKFEVNGRNFVEYIPSAAIRLDVLQPLNITATATQYDIYVNVCGGGISGQAGKAVADKMKIIGKTHQVICVTHLPTIAAAGDSNYFIEKINTCCLYKFNILLHFLRKGCFFQYWLILIIKTNTSTR